VNIILNGLRVVDGLQMVVGDRVVLNGQTDARENGIWVIDTGKWKRSPDFNKARDVVQGTRVWVVEGNSGPAELEVSTEDPIFPGVTQIHFDLSAGSVNAAALSAARAAAEAALASVEAVIDEATAEAVAEAVEEATQQAESFADQANEALQDISAIAASIALIKEFPFTVTVGQTSVPIPGGYDVVAYVLLEGLQITGWTAPGDGSVYFQAITDDDTAGEATAELIVGVGKTSVFAFDTLDGGAI
jgi:hypothetical protein